MDTLNAPNHRDAILKALSQIPIATTKQLAMLNQSLQPQKKASAILRDLEQDSLVQGDYHRREKVWALTRKGRRLTKSTVMKSNDRDHALAIGNVYFHNRPIYWMYEPVEKFELRGKSLFWNPDCILVYRKKVYVVEVQLTPLGRQRWLRKWGVFNTYFNGGYFKEAAFQKWSKSIILPQFLIITAQNPETVKIGFEVADRELIVVTSLTTF